MKAASARQKRQAKIDKLSNKDDFAFYYNNMYKTTIYAQGSIGNIKFYTDHFIKDDKVAFYYDKEEFIFDFDELLVRGLIST